MEREPTDDKLSRKLWLIGHSFPAIWITKHPAKWHNETKPLVPLDPRHPTRHNILTSVLDYLQDRVYKKAWLRLDICKCYVFNAFENDEKDGEPIRAFEDPRLIARIDQWRDRFKRCKPPIVITFGAEAYRFAALSLEITLESKLTAPYLGERFREAAIPTAWDSSGTNLFPLLHAVVAQRVWHEVGKYYDPKREDANYFEYVGHSLAEVLLTNGRQLPIWCEPRPAT